MTPEDIKIRQMTNQYLTDPGSKLHVVRDLCGVQAQFMVNAMHALKLRCYDYDEASLAAGLVKNWTIRGTVHLFAEADLPLFIHCNHGESYRNNEWNGYTFWNSRDKWALTPERQKFFSQIILAALEAGMRTREELKALCLANGMTKPEEDSMFDAWGGGIRELCERGFMNYAVQEKKAYCLSPAFDPIPEEEAKLEIARRYFTNFAPATIHDAMYYLGAKQAEVRYWLSQLPVKTTACEGKTYYYIDNGRVYDRDIPGCLFLAGFDQLMLGYQKKESLYLPPEHLRGIFNLAGIVMPAILLHGRVVGKWKYQRGKLTLTLFTPLDAAEKKLICESAACLWGDIRQIVWEE